MGSLQEDLRRMLNDDRFSDMVFVCLGEQDKEEEVPASRLLVAARSPTLQSMLLTSGMAETKFQRVPLPGIDASTLRICMDFFYTGAVKSSSWGGLFSTMQVFAAGRFFLNPKLEELAMSRFSLYKLVHDEDSFVDVAKAYGCGVVLEHDHSNMLSLMERLRMWIVDDAHLSFGCYKHLSEQAFVHLAQNLRWNRRPTREYVMFHLVVQWCSFQLVSLSSDSSITKQAVLNAFENTLPWTSEDVSKHVAMTADEKKASITPNTLKLMKLLAAPVERCIKKIDLHLSKIPAQVLSKIIEPLEIVPVSILFDTYKQQALSIPMTQDTRRGGSSLSL